MSLNMFIGITGIDKIVLQGRILVLTTVSVGTQMKIILFFCLWGQPIKHVKSKVLICLTFNSISHMQQSIN